MREGDETRKRKRIEKEERSTEEGGGGMWSNAEKRRRRSDLQTFPSFFVNNIFVAQVKVKKWDGCLQNKQKVERHLVEIGKQALLASGVQIEGLQEVARRQSKRLLWKPKEEKSNSCERCIAKNPQDPLHQSPPISYERTGRSSQKLVVPYWWWRRETTYCRVQWASWFGIISDLLMIQQNLLNPWQRTKVSTCRQGRGSLSPQK